jgi:hypothetical protein
MIPLTALLKWQAYAYGEILVRSGVKELLRLEVGVGIRGSCWFPGYILVVLVLQDVPIGGNWILGLQVILSRRK